MPEPGIGPESLEGGMRAAFRKPSPAPPPGVLDSLGPAVPRVLLRDAPDDPTPLIRPRSEELTARQAGRYQIVGEIARGGVGVILKGRDVDLGRDVAMKLLREAHARSPQMVQRFIEEAQIGAQLQHPGIVPVYELGLHTDARPFFTMKLVKGRTLSSLLEERADPARDRPRLLAIFEQVTQTMAYAHARGVVHRDLKPSNVMVGAFGEVQVVDWGFAKVFDHKGAAIHEPAPERTIIATVRAGQEGSQSLAGSVMGTPAYMPPEQALGHVETLDERADVFALGAILCEILTGQPPYTGEQADVLVKASHGRLDDAYRRLEACGADASLVALARRCLAPVPGDRPKDAFLVSQEVSKSLAAAEERARAAEREAAEARAKAEEEHARLAREKLASEQARARAQEEKVRAEEEGAREEQARRKTAWERRARRRTIALAAVVLVAFIGGSATWYQRDRSVRARAAETAAAVARAVEEATLLEGGEEWTAAAAAAQRAVDLARAGDAGAAEAETILARIRAGESRAAAAAAQAAKDRATVARLDEIRAAAADLDPATLVAEYAQAFADYGIDVDSLDPTEAAERVRSSRIADDLIVVLYAWARDRLCVTTLPIGDWNRVFAVARGADTDAWRSQVTEAALGRDLPRLRELAASLDPTRTPPRMWSLVALTLSDLGDNEASLDLFREAQILHPSDFWLNWHLARALTQRKSPDWAGAIRFLTAALALRPESPAVRQALGNVLWAAGEHDGAVDAWRDALEFPMAWPGIVFRNILMALEKRGELDPAIKGWREEASRNPEDRDIRFRLGHALYWKRDWAGAASQFREVVRLDPLYPPGYRSLGSALLQAVEYEDAIATVAQAVRLRPRELTLHKDMGGACAAAHKSWNEAWAAYRVLFPEALVHEQTCFCSGFLATRQTEDPGEAVEAGKEAVRLMPDTSVTHNDLGVTFLAAGRNEEAASSFREAGRLPPPNWMAHSNLGLVLERLGDAAGAIDAYREAIRLAPQASVAHQNIGRLLGSSSSFEEACARYQELVPDGSAEMQAEFHRGLAAGFAEKKDFDGAVLAYRAAVRATPQQVYSDDFWIGVLLERKRDYEGALESYREAIRLEPTALDARLYLAQALQKLDRIPEAIAAYEEAAAVNPYGGEGWVGAREACLGLLFHARGEPERTIDVLKEVATSPRSSAAALAVLSAGLADLGRWEEAAKRLEQALAAPPAKPETSARALFQKELERLGQFVALGPRLPAVLRGDVQPADVKEQLAFARLCHVHGRYEASVRLFRSAFAQDPPCADDLEAGHRFRAACAAALVGDIRQAVEWLRMDLRLREKQIDDAVATQALLVLVGWRGHRQLAPIRDAEALEKLPEADRDACRAFWTEVDAVLRKAWGKE